MGYIKLDNIIRTAIANKGHSTLHLYIPYLHWAFEAIERYQEEGYFMEVKTIKDVLSTKNTFPIPSDMVMWNKLGMVSNGRVHMFVNDDSLSLDPTDFNNSKEQQAQGLFSYDSGALDLLYTTNVYVSTESGVVVVGLGNSNSFKVNWRAGVFQIDKSIGNKKVSLEYVAKAHNPTTETLINEIVKKYIIEFIYYREARFKFGAAARETVASERDWLDAEDDLAASTSDLTANGLVQALTRGTRKTIDQ